MEETLEYREFSQFVRRRNIQMDNVQMFSAFQMIEAPCFYTPHLRMTPAPGHLLSAKPWLALVPLRLDGVETDSDENFSKYCYAQRSVDKTWTTIVCKDGLSNHIKGSALYQLKDSCLIISGIVDHIDRELPSNIDCDRFSSKILHTRDFEHFTEICNSFPSAPFTKGTDVNGRQFTGRYGSWPLRNWHDDAFLSSCGLNSGGILVYNDRFQGSSDDAPLVTLFDAVLSNDTGLTWTEMTMTLSGCASERCCFLIDSMVRLGTTLYALIFSEYDFHDGSKLASSKSPNTVVVSNDGARTWRKLESRINEDCHPISLVLDTTTNRVICFGETDTYQIIYGCSTWYRICDGWSTLTNRFFTDGPRSSNPLQIKYANQFRGHCLRDGTLVLRHSDGDRVFVSVPDRFANSKHACFLAWVLIVQKQLSPELAVIIASFVVTSG